MESPSLEVFQECEDLDLRMWFGDELVAFAAGLNDLRRFFQP